MSRTFHHVNAQQLANDPSWHMIDIRPHDERHGALGFVPGSLSIPTEQIVSEMAAFCDRFEPGAQVALLCTSGRRSAILAEQITDAVPFTVASLDGGTLAWSALGLPLCGVEGLSADAVPDLDSISKFPRFLLSCFAAESVENQLDGRVSALDPNAIISAAIADACPDKLTIQCITAAVERVAAIARRAGFPLEKVQQNVDLMEAVILRLSR
ncbi:MAG: rhodanese-like domain-containing protein [Deltaproteobacteria bacterium]|nr:rhodanese-like domain-containing protein [Deltaproteobacteria bacterium]